MRIAYADFKRNNRYIWLKHVTGVNLDAHCARCLLGEYDSRVSARQSHYDDIGIVTKPNVKAHYLCAVDCSYTHHVHVAFRPKDGAEIRISNEDVDLLIEGAELLPISADSIPNNDPHAGERAFSTCRNWQFAHWLNSGEANRS